MVQHNNLFQQKTQYKIFQRLHGDMIQLPLSKAFHA